MMDRIQQHILQTALQVPEYVGYQAKERRREEDKLIRRQLAGKYREQQTRLERVARRSPLEYVVDIENLDQKLQRLVARLGTAPGGYAGWFDAAQIDETDLDQLTSFDASLAEGVKSLKEAIDSIQNAVQTREAVTDTVIKAGDMIDSLNARFDEREQFLAMGKRPTPIEKAAPVSPLDALKIASTASREFAQAANLKLKDAMSLRNSDYIVVGKITYTAQTETFWAYQLQGGVDETWLHVGPSAEISLHNPVKYELTSPAPEMIDLNGRMFNRVRAGTTFAKVEGIGGSRSGQVTFGVYSAPDDSRLWIEQYGTGSRTTLGQIVDPSEIRVYRR